MNGHQPFLTASEWRLIEHLLQAERDQLPAEIHHTDSRDYRAQLQKRVEMINQILARISNLAEEAVV